jgi:hypothetical protein
VKFICGVSATMSGTAPASPSTTQNAATTTNASRKRSSRRTLRLGHQITNPDANTIMNASMNGCQLPSSNRNDTPTGGSIVRLNNISNRPRMRCTTAMFIDGARSGLEQLADCSDLPAVAQEEDHVVVRLHDRVVMSHDHFVATHRGADRDSSGSGISSTRRPTTGPPGCRARSPPSPPRRRVAASALARYRHAARMRATTPS